MQARSRRVKEELEAIRPLLDRFRQSVLAAAFRGDLTADWREKNPDVEPAEVLLERIRAERRRRWEEAELEKMKAKGKTPKDDKWKEKYKEPESVDSNNLPELPNGWCWMSLGNVAWYVKEGPHYSPKYYDNGIPFISGGNIKPEGIDFKNVKYISSDLHEELSKRCMPEKGDILYTKGGTTGIARVNTYDRPFNVWVHVAVLKCVPSIESFYLQHALNSPHCYQQSQKFTHGVGNQDLGLTRMVNITIPLAPLEEQKEIVHRIESLFKIADTIEQQYQQAEADLETLNQSILAKAFRGELVPQDPNDEPASVLLERIREEKAKQNKSKKGQSRKKTKVFEANQLTLPGMESE